MKKPERTFTWILLLIVLSGGVLRTAISVHREWIGYDEASYLLVARNASNGAGYVQTELQALGAKFHPLPFLAPQALTRLLGDELVASKFLFITLGMLSVGLIGFLGRRLFDPQVGLLAAGLVAVEQDAQKQWLAARLRSSTCSSSRPCVRFRGSSGTTARS